MKLRLSIIPAILLLALSTPSNTFVFSYDILEEERQEKEIEKDLKEPICNIL